MSVMTVRNIEQGYVLPLDKPYGWSSFDAIRYVQRGIRQHFGLSKIKIGHAGTLDPLATGALLICIGKATKQAQTLQDSAKEYRAVLRLGAQTPSYDLETAPNCHKPFAHITAADMESILPLFTGDVLQMPPVFSAKNVGGKRSYLLARSGN
jgi:tRNA pseudouridine55 synthase